MAAAFNPHLDLNKKHLDVRGCWGSDFSHFYRSVQLTSDPVRSAPWTGLKNKLSRYPLAQANEALADVAGGLVLKALIDPNVRFATVRDQLYNSSHEAMPSMSNALR